MSPKQAVDGRTQDPKVSGGFRTLTVAQILRAIRSYISTIRKNGLQAATALHNAVRSTPWMPASAK